MRRILAFLLVLGMFAWPGAVAQTGPVLCYRLDVDSDSCPETVAVDLIEDAGGRIQLEVQSEFFTFPPAAVTMIFDCECGAFQVNLVQDGDSWKNVVLVDRIDLVKGSWNVTAQATGSGQTQSLEAKTLTVTADDDDAPEITIDGLVDGRVALGAGDLLRISINDTLPGRVTYRAGWMPPTPFVVGFPYDIAVGTFRPGEQQVTVTAHDRAGQSTSLTFTLFADARDPEVSVDAPDVFYQGIENKINVTVKEHSAYTVTVTVGGASATASGTGNATEQDLELAVVPTDVGSSILRIQVTDALQNEVILESPTTVTKLETDAVLVDVMHGDPAIQGEAAKLNVTGLQQDPLAPVTFDIMFEGQSLGTLHIEHNETAWAIAKADFEPGRYPGVLRLVPPESVTELNFTDQERSVTIEVFLARVIHGEDWYHIRADDRGLPLEAVGPDGAVYQLRTENEGLGQVYAFTVDGQRLYWNPGSNTTIVPVMTQTTTTTTDNGAAGVAIVPLVALIALAAWSRRR